MNATEAPYNSTTITPPVELFQGYSDALLQFAAISCILFVILGVPGNLITIIALARCKKVRNATAVFIINLSLSDLLFCCFNLPLAASTFLNRAWKHSQLLCRLFPLLRYGLLAVSLFTILAITINRYVMIGHPRIYPRIYQRKFLIVMVATCWICAFLPLVFTWCEMWGKFGMDSTIGSCSIIPDENGHSPKEFLFIIAFALPCLCISICYARIFYIVRKTHETVIKSGGSVKISNPNGNTNKMLMESPNDANAAAVIIIGSNNNSQSSAVSGQQQHLGGVSTAATTDGLYDENQQQRANVKQKKKFGRRDKSDVKLLPTDRLIDRDDYNNRHYHQKQYQKRPPTSQYSSEPSSSSYSGISGSDGSSGVGVGGMSAMSVTKNSKLNRQALHDGEEESSGNSVSFVFNRNDSFNSCSNNNNGGQTIDSIEDEKLGKTSTTNNSSGNGSSRASSLYKRQRAYLSKLGDEELKFIDTSVESDLPPTLSNLRNTTNSKTSTQLNTKLNDTSNFAKSNYTRQVGGDGDSNDDNNAAVDGIYIHKSDDIEVDSAVENSTSSMEQIHDEHGRLHHSKKRQKQQRQQQQQQQPRHQTLNEPPSNKLSGSVQYLGVQIEPSSSSGIDIPNDPYDKQPRRGSQKKRSFVSKLRKSTRLRSRSRGNTSGASFMYPGRMTSKDKRLLKMILVIFLSFLICYLPITINKIFDTVAQNHAMNILGYLLIYLTTCINPMIYVVMSSEYRQAYKNLLMCKSNTVRNGHNKIEVLRNASPRE